MSDLVLHPYRGGSFLDRFRPGPLSLRLSAAADAADARRCRKNERAAIRLLEKCASKGDRLITLNELRYGTPRHWANHEIEDFAARHGLRVEVHTSPSYRGHIGYTYKVLTW